jgi:hypothetical protein
MFNFILFLLCARELIVKEKWIYIFISLFRTGIHETGMLVGCLRRLQHWCFNAIITEVSHKYMMNKMIFITVDSTVFILVIKLDI